MTQDVLTQICADKRLHVAHQKDQIPLSILRQQIEAAPACRGFIAALTAQKAAGKFGLIAEVKKASPSKGLIRDDFDPAKLAALYQEAGASCVSVLTDTPYFMGTDDDFRHARAACSLPMIRKDFTIDPYQVYETRAMGADCLLLIMAALTDDQAKTLYDLAIELGLDVLVEVHDADEAERALKLTPRMIGINNRNLKTLEVNINTSCQIAPTLPPDILCVGESGLNSRGDLDRLAQAGTTSF